MIIIKNYSDFEVPIKVYDSDGLPINPLDASVLDISVFTTSKNSSLEFDKSDIDPERITISIDGQDASLLDNGVLFYQYHLEMEDPKYPDGNYKAERLVQTDIYIMNVQEGHKSTCATMVSELINDAGYITLLEARPIIEEEVIKDISTLVLDEYATKEYVDQAVDNEKDRAEIVESRILNRIGNIEEELDAKQDVLVSGTNIKTINNISILGSGNIDISSGSIDPQDLSIYATKEWVEGQGYLTEHQSLEGYATEEYVDGSIDAVRDEIPEVPTNVSAFTNDAGYLTSHQDISGKQDVLVSGTNIKTINNISILGSGNIDISAGGSNIPYLYLHNIWELNPHVISYEERRTIDSSYFNVDAYDAVVNAIRNKENHSIIISNWYSRYLNIPYTTSIETNTSIEPSEYIAVNVQHGPIRAYLCVNRLGEYWCTFVQNFLTNNDLNNYVDNSTFEENNEVISAAINTLIRDKADKNEIPEVPTNVSAFNNDAGYLTEHQDISGKQDVLVSGTNIKTINNISILGSGNIDISSGSIDPQDLSIYATKQYVDSSFLPLTGGIIDGSLKIKYKPIIIGNDANKLKGADNLVQLTSVKDICLIPGISGSLYKGYNDYGNQILSFKELGNNYYNKTTIDASIAEVKALIPDVSTFATKQYVDGSINQVRAEIPTVPTNVSAFTNDAGYLTQHQDISGKQDVLVSGTNIKTINNVSILGSGNIDISSGSIDPQDLSIYATKEYVDANFYYNIRSFSANNNVDIQFFNKNGQVTKNMYLYAATNQFAGIMDASQCAKLENAVISNQVANMWAGTQAEYDALSVKDASTFYIIKAN